MKTFNAGQKHKAKTFINNILAKSNPKGNAIVLDGTDTQTTKTMVKHGWNKNQIEIPNYSQDYYQIIRKHQQTTKTTLNQLIKNTRKKYRLIYADYMCSFEGNSNCKPREDIEELFTKKLLLPGGLFAITLAQRTIHKNNTPLKGTQLFDCVDFIKDSAEKNGQKAHLLQGGTYTNQGPMATMIFQIR